MSETSLVVQDLRFAYPGLPLFEGWSHAFATGLTWIRGENGCGKSTLLKLIGGALDAQAGTIRRGRHEAREQPLDYRRGLYWCGPDEIAFDHLRPLEFFGFVAGLYPGFDESLALRLVAQLGLEPFLPRRISEMSTGTRRKVAVIAAIAARTQVVVLDEPLLGLDQASLAVMTTELAAAASRPDRIWLVASHEPIGAAAESAAILDLPRRSR